MQCDQILRAKYKVTMDIDHNDMDKDALAEEARVLPLYEKKMNEIAGLRQYSMLNNEELACEWRKKLSMMIGRYNKGTMRQFPDISDYHFYNYCNRFMPSLSRKHAAPLRLTLTPGPGTDRFGEKPIPNDMMLRKSEAVPIHPKPKITNIKKSRYVKPKKY